MYIISEADVMIDIIWFMPLIFIGEALLTPQLLDVNQFCEWFKLRVNCQELLWCTTWSSHHLHFLCLQLPSSFEKILGVQCKMNLSVDHTLKCISSDITFSNLQIRLFYWSSVVSLWVFPCKYRWLLHQLPEDYLPLQLRNTENLTGVI